MLEARIPSDNLAREVRRNVEESNRILVRLQQSLDQSSAAIEESKRMIKESAALIAQLNRAARDL